MTTTTATTTINYYFRFAYNRCATIDNEPTTVWLCDCMTVDILDMFDKLEDMLDTLNSLRVSWERKSCNNANCCGGGSSATTTVCVVVSCFSLKLLSSCLTCLTCLSCLTCLACLRCPQSYSHAVIQSTVKQPCKSQHTTKHLINSKIWVS